MQPDIHTELVLPHISLQPFLRFFGIRSFDTLGQQFPKSIHAENEIQLNFFFHCKLFGFKSEEKDNSEYFFDAKNETQSYFTGIQTSTNGAPVFNGHTTIITLHFNPVGFYFIFGISPKEILNQHGETANILSKEIKLLYEQMENASTVWGGVSILESYLLKKVLHQKMRYKNPGIKFASDLLLINNGMYSIKKLASDCNLTQQTMEVNFTDQVGVTPKEFSRIIRFNHAVKMKLYNSGSTWTNIAHSCGFFDQMHLIREFKKFTTFSPKEFMEIINPPLENFGYSKSTKNTSNARL